MEIQINSSVLEKISKGKMSPKVSKLLNEVKGEVDTIKNRKEILFLI